MITLIYKLLLGGLECGLHRTKHPHLNSADGSSPLSSPSFQSSPFVNIYCAKLLKPQCIGSQMPQNYQIASLGFLNDF